MHNLFGMPVYVQIFCVILIIVAIYICIREFLD